MSKNIGHFEILSELAKSESGCVYKANDPESGQMVALKTIHLEALGEHAQELVQRVLQEAESTKDLDCPNVTVIYGAGEIEGQLCATMDYIQGNSIATMLARKEGFSIWDLLDISTQVCQGLDHAHQHKVVHYSLEPAKIMVTWDGTVKILSFGISTPGFMAAVASGTPPSTLYYMSPEQVCGETMDARSNLFTWGAMLYEMVADQKAFDGADADEVRRKILEEMPAPPDTVNPKISAIASAVIMKALAKDPTQRYQSGREMANDLEKCRENTGKAKKAEPPKGTVVPDKAKAAAAAAKFAAPSSAPKAPATPPAAKFEPRAPEPRFAPSAPSLSSELETSWTPPAPPAEPAQKGTAGLPPTRANKAAAAAAGWGSTGASNSAPKATYLDPSSQFVTSVVRASVDTLETRDASMSSAVLDEPAKPKIAVDPMMAQGAGATSQGVSFSDLEELPPLKEIYVAPPTPKADTIEEGAEPLPSIILRGGEPEKPKIQPREVAEKAIQEIKSLPPQLLLYSISAAVALILVVSIAVFWRSHSQNTDEEGQVPAAAASTSQPAQPAATEQGQPQAAASDAPFQAEPALTVEERPSSKTTAAPGAKARTAKNRKSAAPSAPIPGQLAVSSTPEGAQVQIDGQGDPGWITPYTVTAIAPGQHTIVVSKAGYGQETRTADVTSANRASLMVHLTALVASVAVASDPVGASIYVDGKDTLRVTPYQITLDKGTHTILVRKAGYLDETTSVTAVVGQTTHYAATLRSLGNVDQIKTVGKFKKLFGGKVTDPSMGKVSVKTTPKGAQVSVNRRMLDKGAPVDFLLNPGNYVIDITLTGYKPVQKVIVVDQGGSVSVDETLQRE
jgi:serine/threonine-protein kinase